MNNLKTSLLIPITLCLIGSLNLAHAMAVDSRMSGSWFDPTHNGEGFVLQVLDEDIAVVYWFTYDESGRQRWFTATGTVEGDTASFEQLLQAGGAVFGDSFDPEQVQLSDRGELSITWADCSNAVANYTVNGVAGNQQLVRLSTLAGLNCEEPGLTASPLSGSWFDRTHNGEGLAIEMLQNGFAVIYWFSYDDKGEQAWFTGVGEVDGSLIQVQEMYITSGGRFGPDFDPQQVELESWGQVDIALDCDFGKLDYFSDFPIYGEGKQTLIRLTEIGNPACEASKAPNILLVIADDMGKDSFGEYDVSSQQPLTPVLSQLANEGLVFENAWSNPSCSSTRAGMLTGKHGSRTGVLSPGDVLSVDEVSLQDYIHQHLPGKYSDAVIGKWHLGPRPEGLDHPSQMGVSYFSGITGGGVDDYEDWTLVTNGERSNEVRYTTSKLVDIAIDWTEAQDSPWFLWLAFNAPHTPFHLPPEDLHDRQLPGTPEDINLNPQPYYFAAIEAMDSELGRLLNSFDEETRENTIILFLGDNGTPAQVAQQPYSRNTVKGSLYQGGINVPLFVSGPGVSRKGEREFALVNTTDLFSTIAALAGVNVAAVNDSVSITPLLGETLESERVFQYSEQSTDRGEEWAVSDGMYKLIESESADQQVYALFDDPYENADLVESGTVPAGVIADLQFLADEIRQEQRP